MFAPIGVFTGLDDAFVTIPPPIDLGHKGIDQPRRARRRHAGCSSVFDDTFLARRIGAIAQS
jgi:hypothetical protein